MNDEPTEQELKAVINNLLWMYGPKNMTLEEAEGLACKWCKELVTAWREHRRPNAVARG